jgi:acetylornithine deacetylase
MANSSTETLNQVLTYIDRTQDELVEFLAQLIRYRSINPDMLDRRSESQMRECQEWLGDELRRWGVFDEVRLVGPDPEQPNVVAIRKGNGTGPGLLFNGHTDVVPVSEDQQAAWTIGTPWGGTVVDGKVVGRGATDMKGGCAAFLWAIKALAQTGVTLKGDILATLVSGEETGNHEIGIDVLAQEGYTAPFAILAEPTDLQIAPASVGEFYFLIRVEGRSTSLANRHLSIYPAPSGIPVAGVNAIDKMMKIQRALADLEREWGIWQRHPLMAPGNMNINFSRIHGGEAYSSMADTCELTGSVLFNPALSFAEVLAEFQRAIDGVVQSDYWLREHPPTITVPYILDAKEPINVSPDHPGCQALARAYTTVFRCEPTMICTTATSDGNYLFARGQTIVTFGPGSSDAGVHGPNEFIDIVDVVNAAKVYAAAAIEWSTLATS